MPKPWRSIRSDGVYVLMNDFDKGEGQRHSRHIAGHVGKGENPVAQPTTDPTQRGGTQRRQQETRYR